MSNRLIDLQHITKIYDDNTVLDDLNLYIRENEFLTLLGPSGCGKTTTLRIIGGFEKPDNGCVLFNGKDITEIDQCKYRSQMVGVIFQGYNLLLHYNAVDNVILSMDISGKHFENKKDVALENLSKVGLSGDKIY